MIYLDTETCGLHGVPVILQYAKDQEQVKIHEIWNRPIGETLDLIEDICKDTVVAFNLVFDWFHIQKIYTMFHKFPRQWIPAEHIKEIASFEKAARDGPCVKPVGAFDLMLYLRKTEYQITMDRQDIRIRRVPTVLAYDLAKELTKRLRLNPILFAGYKKQKPLFSVDDVEDNPKLKTLTLRFRPSSALKAIIQNVFKDEVIKFADIEVPKQFRPLERGYAPFAFNSDDRLKIKGPTRYAPCWPDVLPIHIDHWQYREDAREYARRDVEYLRRLCKHFNCYSNFNDVDSQLACCVASCRWKGYALDIPKLESLIQTYKAKLTVPTAARRVREWLGEKLDPIEKAIISKSTDKKSLKALVELGNERAKQVLEARAAEKKVQILEKLLFAGRFHASFKVIGALSGRMSGADKLNAQGIDRTKEVRSCFPLAFPGYDLTNGDMQSFEVCIADAAFDDPELRKELLTCDHCDIQVDLILGKPKCPKCGKSETKSFHGLFGMGFFNCSYKEIMASKGKDINLYNPAKNAGFATIYGAQAKKLADTLSQSGITVDEDQASLGLLRFWNRYKVAGKKRRQIEMEFTQIMSIGRKFEIRQPKEAIESLLGFKRYFNLEHEIIKTLYNLACDPPKSWESLKQLITRSQKGEQTVLNATRSAIFGAMFGIQNSTIRQAQNHQIQSTGAGITKAVQARIWEFQPAGIHEWLVQPMNVHDEIPNPCKPELVNAVIKAVYDKVETFRSVVPLIAIDFGKSETWADK